MGKDFRTDFDIPLAEKIFLLRPLAYNGEHDVWQIRLDSYFEMHRDIFKSHIVMDPSGLIFVRTGDIGTGQLRKLLSSSLTNLPYHVEAISSGTANNYAGLTDMLIALFPPPLATGVVAEPAAVPSPFVLRRVPNEWIRDLALFEDLMDAKGLHFEVTSDVVHATAQLIASFKNASREVGSTDADDIVEQVFEVVSDYHRERTLSAEPSVNKLMLTLADIPVFDAKNNVFTRRPIRAERPCTNNEPSNGAKLITLIPRK